MAVYKATPKGEKGEILGQQQQRSNVPHVQRDQFYPIPAKDFKGKLKKQTLSLKKAKENQNAQRNL